MNIDVSQSPTNKFKIKGLYFIWNESKETPYLLAVSLDEEKLQNILQTIKKEPDGEYIIIEVKLYVLTKIYNKLLLSRAISFTEEFIGNKVYTMNKIEYAMNNLRDIASRTTGCAIRSLAKTEHLESNESVNQVLIRIIHDSDENSEEYKTFIEEIRNDKLFEENNFSLNSIKFDIYYEDGMLNA